MLEISKDGELLVPMRATWPIDPQLRQKVERCQPVLDSMTFADKKEHMRKPRESWQLMSASEWNRVTVMGEQDVGRERVSQLTSQLVRSGTRYVGIFRSSRM